MHQCHKFSYFRMTLYMFRTVFPSIIRSSRLYIQQFPSIINSRLYVQQQVYVKRILLTASSVCQMDTADC